jgi:hypothetical protein
LDCSNAPGLSHIIDTLYDDRILAQADKSFHGLNAAFDPCFFSVFRVQFRKFLGTEKFRQHILRQCLSVADRSEKVLRPAKSIFVRDPFHLAVVIDQLLWRNAKPARFFFKELAAKVDRISALLLLMKWRMRLRAFEVTT